MSNYNKITALYSHLSVGDEDRNGGESNSIQNQESICQGGYFAFQYGLEKAERCQPLLAAKQHCAGQVSRIP